MARRSLCWATSFPRWLALPVALLAAGCEQRPDHLAMRFQNVNGQQIPDGLPDPARWQYSGAAVVPGTAGMAAWVEPKNTPAPASKTKGAVKPRPTDWAAGFEYQNLPLPAVASDKYLDIFKAKQAENCPTASVTPLRVDKNELLLEAKSGGCARFGTQSEIDRFLFGENRLFHMVYTIQSLELSPPDRADALRAVNAWNLAP